MPDVIIEELWRIKDGIAREHGNDVRKLAAYLQRSHPPDSEGKSATDGWNKPRVQRPFKTDEGAVSDARSKRAS